MIVFTIIGVVSTAFWALVFLGVAFGLGKSIAKAGEPDGSKPPSPEAVELATSIEDLVKLFSEPNPLLKPPPRNRPGGDAGEGRSK